MDYIRRRTLFWRFEHYIYDKLISHDLLNSGTVGVPFLQYLIFISSCSPYVSLTSKRKMHDQNMAQGEISIFSLYNIFSTYICIIYLQHNDNVVSQHLRESPSDICGVA